MWYHLHFLLTLLRAGAQTSLSLATSFANLLLESTSSIPLLRSLVLILVGTVLGIILSQLL